MVDAAETSRTRAFVASEQFLIDLSPAVPGFEIGDTLSSQTLTAINTTAVETIINGVRYSCRFPTLWYGDETEALNSRQGQEASLVILSLDMAAFAIIPGGFGGMATSGPSRGTVERAMEWSEGGIPIDGGPVSGKDRLVPFDFSSGDTSISDINVSSGDKVYILISEFNGSGITVSFGSASAITGDGTKLVEVTGYGTSLTPDLTSSGISGNEYIRGYALIGVETSSD